MRICPKAQKRLEYSFLIFSYPKTPKTALYKLWFWPFWLQKHSGKKWKISSKNRSKCEKFTYTRVIYLKMKLRMCIIQIQKEKVWFFCEKKYFWISSIFFPKGGPFYQKSSLSVLQRFQKKVPKTRFLGPFRHRKEQSQEFWWA